MTVRQISIKLGLESLCMPDPDREVTGGYAGDLLSWVMGRAKSGDAWVTIMSNTNVIAVATLTEPAAIVLAEDVRLSEDALANAKANDITVLSTKLSAYEICARVARATEESDV